MDFNVKIYIRKGVYHEKLIVPSWIQHVELIGEQADSTVITNADHANINNMGTFRTFTVRVDGNDITLRNLTIENNAPRLGHSSHRGRLFTLYWLPFLGKSRHRIHR